MYLDPTPTRKRIPVAQRREFLNSLARANQESDVEKALERAATNLVFNFVRTRYGIRKSQLSYPHNTDGLVSFTDEHGVDRFVLIEAKKDLNLARGALDLHKVLAPVIYYLKRLQRAGESIPTAGVILDADEICSFSTNMLVPYLPQDFDWDIAPSDAGRKNLNLVSLPQQDPNVSRIYVHAGINVKTILT